MPIRISVGRSKGKRIQSLLCFLGCCVNRARGGFLRAWLGWVCVCVLGSRGLLRKNVFTTQSKEGLCWTHHLGEIVRSIADKNLRTWKKTLSFGTTWRARCWPCSSGVFPIPITPRSAIAVKHNKTVRERNRENVRNASSGRKIFVRPLTYLKQQLDAVLCEATPAVISVHPWHKTQCSLEPPSIICCVVFLFFLLSLYIRRCVLCSFPGHLLFVSLALVRAYEKWVMHRWSDVISSHDAVNFCHLSQVRNVQKCTGLCCKWESLKNPQNKKWIMQEVDECEWHHSCCECPVRVPGVASLCVGSRPWIIHVGFLWRQVAVGLLIKRGRTRQSVLFFFFTLLKNYEMF